MTVRVRLFAMAAQVAGRDTVQLELPAAATVGELRGALSRAVPGLAPLAGHMLLAVNGDYADDLAPIPPEAEVACIPPVSGG